jgi:hypothetical protein
MPKEKPAIQQIKDRKWQWIGHRLRQDPLTVERQVLYWNPQGRRKGRRPKEIWRRMVEEEIGKVGKTWEEVGTLAQIRIRWKSYAPE